MRVRTKKRRTDKNIVLTFRGPEMKRREAVEALSELGFVDTTDTVPWREAFLEIAEEDSPGLTLKVLRQREGLTQKALAEKADIPQSHISMMERGKMSIGVARAKKLGIALNAGYKLFL